MTRHGEGDDKAFCDVFLRVRPGSKPYYDPIVGEFRIQSHYHSNIATARKNTQSGRWGAAKYTDVNNEENWQFQRNYLEIFAGKIVTKGNEVCKAPVFDLMTWLFRAKTFKSDYTLAQWLKDFKREFNLTSEEFQELFSENNLDGTKPADNEFFVPHKFSDGLLLKLLEDPTGFDLSEAITETAESERNTRVTETDIVSLVKNGRLQIILQGPPGTGKTLLAKRAAAHLLGIREEDFADKTLEEYYLDASTNIPPHLNTKGGWTLVQFHPSYAYDDFVQGINAKIDQETRTPSFSVQDGAFLRICALAAKTEKPVVLIIDEINRGDLSKIFGELVYSLEYRGSPISLRLENDGKRIFRVPSNLIILGTMNSADRSISHIDYAIRRRFAFITVPPDRSVIENVLANKSTLKAALELFDSVTQALQENSSYSIGHSFFLASEKNDLANRFVFQVLPLLDEYRREGILDDSISIRPKNWPGSSGIPLRHQRPFDLVEQVVSWISSL